MLVTKELLKTIAKADSLYISSTTYGDDPKHPNFNWIRFSKTDEDNWKSEIDMNEPDDEEWIVLHLPNECQKASAAMTLYSELVTLLNVIKLNDDIKFYFYQVSDTPRGQSVRIPMIQGIRLEVYRKDINFSVILKSEPVSLYRQYIFYNMTEAKTEAAG